MAKGALSSWTRRSSINVWRMWCTLQPSAWLGLCQRWPGKARHDDVRDNDARLADMVWGGVSVEPIMIPENDRRGRSQLRADWMARGVWESGRVAFFDNRIVEADAPSYTNISWEAVANRAANAKKTKYNPAVEELRGTFTPLVCSTDGVLHREYRAYQIRLASRLATKWQRPYSVVMKWVKATDAVRSISCRPTCACEARGEESWALACKMGRPSLPTSTDIDSYLSLLSRSYFSPFSFSLFLSLLPLFSFSLSLFVSLSLSLHYLLLS